MKNKLQKSIPHLLSIVAFIAISVAFFYPVLQGKSLLQSDIVQYTGMAKERNDLREQGRESYWTDSAFAGMPTYQLGAQYPYDFVKKLDRAIRFLPRPADYLFLYFIGFYLLLLVLKVDNRTAFLGAVAFGFSTYLIIILGVGHNAKAHAIGYFAPVLAGILLVFDKKYLWGGLLTAVAVALEINANHYQMTYYLLLLVLLLGIFKGIQAFREKALPHFGKSVSVLSLAAIIAVLANATPLLATQEYAKWSTRGSSSLTISPDGLPKKSASGLSREYITEYSYGITESFNLFVPRLFGGSNNEALGEDSQTYRFLVSNGVSASQALDFANGLPTYWGSQPIVAAPAYIGAVVFFLFVVALFIVKDRLKWWLLGGAIMSLLLSWGKNFALLTDFMIDYFPLYDKFRAVSSIQVLLELCVPALAMLGLQRFFSEPSAAAKKALNYTLYITLGLVVILFVSKGFFSFTGASDGLYQQYYGKELIAMITEDRKAIYTADLLRSTIFILLTALGLAMYQYGKLSKMALQGVLLGLVLFDLSGVARRYVSADNFVSQKQLQQPFAMTQADAHILSDTARFRVYEPSVGINGARTSYFHNSVGGYHAAKPRRLQELFDYQIANGNMQLFNMLNVKYFITKNDSGQPQPVLNDEALGNAWFVSRLIALPTDDAIMQALTNFNPQTEALIHSSEANQRIEKQEFTVDSLSVIRLDEYHPDRLQYQTDNPHDGFAVFSEAHYPQGWKATIDGQDVDFQRVDYMLRGMYIPAGKHTVTFTFEPQVVRQGSLFSLTGNGLLVLWLLLAAYITFRKRTEVPN